jgi:hypothetical protein
MHQGGNRGVPLQLGERLRLLCACRTNVDLEMIALGR